MNELVAEYARQGYTIVRGLWRPDEVAACRERFHAITAEVRRIPATHPPQQDHWAPESSTDTIKRYVRVVNPHQFDDLARRMLLDRRIHELVRALFDEEPLASQSMFYFKPPGARGPGFHQDNVYLQVQPGSCIAAWTAIDPATPENGGLEVVPGSHALPVICPEPFESSEDLSARLLQHASSRVPAILEPGDTLLFHGSLIHGSDANRSQGTWRRSFICHYIPESARSIARYFRPLTSFTGETVVRDHAGIDLGPCGAGFDPKTYSSYNKG